MTPSNLPRCHTALRWHRQNTNLFKTHKKHPISHPHIELWGVYSEKCAGNNRVIMALHCAAFLFNSLSLRDAYRHSNASVTTRRTCYSSCVSGAAAELRLKFCVSCGWLGSESDSPATVLATHVSCGRRASDAMNRTQKIPQRRHVQRTGAVPSRYLQRAFAVPSASCPYGGVRVCTSMARRRCVEGTTHVRRTHGHILHAQSIYIAS